MIWDVVHAENTSCWNMSLKNHHITMISIYFCVNRNNFLSFHRWISFFSWCGSRHWGWAIGLLRVCVWIVMSCRWSIVLRNWRGCCSTHVKVSGDTSWQRTCSKRLPYLGLGKPTLFSAGSCAWLGLVKEDNVFRIFLWFHETCSLWYKCGCAKSANESWFFVKDITKWFWFVGSGRHLASAVLSTKIQALYKSPVFPLKICSFRPLMKTSMG